MASYMPAGFEDSDEDGFQSGEEDYSKYNCAPTSHHELTESSQAAAAEDGGFPTFSQPRSWNERRAEPSISAEDFRMAVTQGNAKAVKDILDKGMDVNVEFPTGWTALMYAGNCGHTEIFKQLLERGANPAFHKDLYTVLMAICGASGQKMEAVKECVKLLVDKKVDVNCRDRHHMTALMYAAREGCKDIVQMLLDSGAEMDRQDSRGWTALSWATHRDKLGVVKLLLERGADQHKQHADGLTAIDMARGREQIIWLFEGKSSGSGAGEGDQGFLAAAAAAASGAGAPTNLSKGADNLKYGDLEMFLFGLQLGQLYPLFLAHHVDFPLLLTLTEQDLTSMGVSQVGLRLKLMEGIAAVHKRNWETSSLVPIRVRSQVKCPDAIAIVANLSTHLRYISSSATYIKDNIKKNPQFMALSQESADPRQLLLHTGDALKNTRQLYNELCDMHSALSSELGGGGYSTPDLLPDPTARRWVIPSGVKLALIGAGVFTVASLAFKKDNALENTRDFFNRWHVRMVHAWLRFYY